MTDLDLARQDVAETLEAYAGAMRAVRGASRALFEGKAAKARALLFQALAAHGAEVAWSDVGGDSDGD